VVAGPPAAGATDADVPDGKRFQFTTITIHSRDRFGNELKTGGYAGQFVVKVSGDNSATPVVSDNGDGTYSATYLPFFKGHDQIDITLNGVAIKGSPYRSEVRK